MIASPCINVCQMDSASGLCLGCFRTLDEIAAWSRIDDPARSDILAAVARRRYEHDPREGKRRSDCNRNG
jgi:predicted Fe-S protein YdhL (DUF1289 family)